MRRAQSAFGDTATGKLVRGIKETRNVWPASAFSPDGKFLAAGEGTLNIAKHVHWRSWRCSIGDLRGDVRGDVDGDVRLLFSVLRSLPFKAASALEQNWQP